jgi:hypothetical protein
MWKLIVVFCKKYIFFPQFYQYVKQMGPDPEPFGKPDPDPDTDLPD